MTQGAFARVVVPSTGSAVPLPTTHVSVRMPIGKHETATFRFSDRTLGRRLRRDSAVQIVFGSGRDQATFVGYINRVSSKAMRGSPVPVVTVNCIGASYKLSSARSRSWFGNYPKVVGEVARLNQFRSTVEPNRSTLRGDQAGKTDWEFLKLLAAHSGRILYCRGVQVVFITRDYWLGRSKTGAPRLTLGQRAAQGDILEFKPVATSHDPRNPSTDIQVSGVRNGRVFTSAGKGASSVLRVDSRSVVKNQLEAAERAQAKAENARYSVRVNVLATGNARVEQAKPVFLSGVASQYAGYWLVDEVLHVIQKGVYRMEVALVTDALKHADDPVGRRGAPDVGGVTVFGAGGSDTVTVGGGGIGAAPPGLDDEPDGRVVLEVNDGPQDFFALPILGGGTEPFDPESTAPSDITALEDALEDGAALSVDDAISYLDVWVAEGGTPALIDAVETERELIWHLADGRGCCVDCDEDLGLVALPPDPNGVLL